MVSKVVTLKLEYALKMTTVDGLGLLQILLALPRLFNYSPVPGSFLRLTYPANIDFILIDSQVFVTVRDYHKLPL